jgi:membrane protein DedA with SNARE-associated domain
MNSLLLISQHWLTKLGGSASAVISSIGGIGVMLLAIGDSSFLSIPEANDLLIVVLSAGKSWTNMVYFVSLTITGSVIGCMILYMIGRKGGSPILRRRFTQQKIERAEKLFERFGILTVIIPSIIPPPMPFKIFVLSAGVFRLRVWEFLIAVIIGRTIRYSMWGILAVVYGNTVKSYMQQNLNLMATIFTAGFALVLVILCVYYFWRRRTDHSTKIN